ncbi:presequence protease, mitochondrial-like isoform X2 [Ptychodera flava]|uniref:presequence protease, mitochondrial-like isoform X2 n=1 Tax=Ptychodera flava TaxID=63121 RepID=UPI00396A6AD7
MFPQRYQLQCRPICSRRARSSSAILQEAEKYQPGQHIHGFTVDKVEKVSELHLSAIKLTHDATGAQYLHVARDDSNNVFSVGFRTTPMDDTGVPHILEHTVLCGSDKYPVRDPFFKMLTRSLSTFLNAMTACDYTVYPFSSQNAKDFENLLSVYLDAVFFPRLKEFDFSQEGWRLEHEDVNNANSPIIFKGVVFNEMKGALTSPDQMFAIHVQNKILPSHTYATNYGGDPLKIPNLTVEQLREFHSTHYHPSNARFYTYGDMPMERHLEFIQNHALSKFTKIQPDTDVPKEERWTEPREDHVYCAVDPMAADPNKQTTLSISYLLEDISDTFESFTASILGSLLTAGPTSPFYQALLDANIGSDYAPVVGYDSSTKEATFSIGLKGISENDVETVKNIIEDTFDKVIQEGFPEERIEAVLHKIELSLKHQTTQFGLGVISSLMPSWNHGGDPMVNLQINKCVDQFKKSMAENPRFLQDKIEAYFKCNTHKLTLTMSPDSEYEAKKSAEEQVLLQEKLNSLSEDQKTEVFNHGIELAKIQNSKEDLSCLPTLKISDINPELKRTQVKKAIIESVPVQLCEQPTNGVTYFRAVANLKKLPEELMAYVPLFCSVITNLGAGVMSHHELAQREELKTGGLNVSTHTVLHHSNMNSHEQGVLISSYCLDHNMEDMFDLWTEIFHRANFDDKNTLTTLIQMEAADMANSLPHHGHHYAMLCAGSSLTPLGKVKELFGGMTQVAIMKKIAEMKDLEPVINNLKMIAHILFNRKNFRCALNTTAEGLDPAVSSLEKFLQTVAAPSKADPASHVKMIEVSDFKPSSRRIHFPLPFPVNYMGQCLPTVPYSHRDCASLRVLSKLMTSKFLHREIREKGGAYGGGASMGTSGIFTFYSYRDPNNIETLQAFKSSAEWASQGKYTQQEIDEAKLSVFQTIDYPIAPPSRGMTLFLTGITDDMKQTHREQLFAVTRDDLVNVAQKYLLSDHQTNGIAFLGPETPLTRENDDWMKVVDGQPSYIHKH